MNPIVPFVLVLILVGAVVFYAGEQLGAGAVDAQVSSELKTQAQGSLLGGTPDYSTYVATLEAGCNSQIPSLQNMSAQLKALNEQLQKYESLPYNSTVAAEIQSITSQTQLLQMRIQLAMTQISQCWNVVSSILQSLNQMYQIINSTVNGRAVRP